MKLLERPEKVMETLSQVCLGCDAKLEIFVLRREAGIPDHAWLVVKCKNCNEYNLLSPGPGIKQMRYGNFTEIDYLLKSEYNEEQAKIRMEQIKFFRKE